MSGTTASVVWKLGGTARPESLTILNDPEFTTGSGFGGQHDARVLDDGSVTIFDNGFHPDTVLRHPPRAVRYAIDAGAGTATLLEQVNDPSDASARRLLRQLTQAARGRLAGVVGQRQPDRRADPVRRSRLQPEVSRATSSRTDRIPYCPGS